MVVLSCIEVVVGVLTIAFSTSVTSATHCKVEQLVGVELEQRAGELVLQIAIMYISCRNLNIRNIELNSNLTMVWVTTIISLFMTRRVTVPPPGQL